MKKDFKPTQNQILDALSRVDRCRGCTIKRPAGTPPVDPKEIEINQKKTEDLPGLRIWGALDLLVNYAGYRTKMV